MGEGEATLTSPAGRDEGHLVLPSRRYKLSNEKLQRRTRSIAASASQGVTVLSKRSRPRPAGAACTNLVHNGGMRAAKSIRQSISLPTNVAAQVRSMAKTRRLSANRMLVELIENGIEAERRKQREFFDLAERFRSATDPKDVKRLGGELGRMAFGG